MVVLEIQVVVNDRQSLAGVMVVMAPEERKENDICFEPFEAECDEQTRRKASFC